MSDPRATVELRILGTLEAVVDGQPVELGPPKQRALLAALILHPNQVVATDRLVEMIWGDRAPRTAAHSVQLYVSALRKSLAGDESAPLIETRTPGYLLRVERHQIDAFRYEDLVEQGIRAAGEGRTSETSEFLQTALELWRGPPLSEFTYEEFAQEPIRRLEELQARAEEELAAIELTTGDPFASMWIAEDLVERHPLRERPRELLMRGLYRSGRQADALREFAAFRALLADELGIEPSVELAGLEDQMLLSDPGLGTVVGGTAVSANPYKGLRPFVEADADAFFGRDELIEVLVAQVEEGRRLVSVVGPSGSGKSSLVRAGLIPTLNRHRPELTLVSMVPGRWPMESLRAAARRAGMEEPPGDAGPDPDTGPILVVVDQFEELYTLAFTEEAGRFVDLLLDLARPGGSVTVVLALRADFYDRPLLHPALADRFTDSVVNVIPMSPTGLEIAVVEPATRAGVTVEPALLAQLVADVSSAPGGLPLFQYTLTELFEYRQGQALTLSDYQEIGGVRGALTARADQLYQDLAPDQQALTRQVFLRLVHATPHGSTRRRLPVRELLDLDLDPVALKEILDRFAAHRLLTFDHDPEVGGGMVEVAHEALFEEWRVLRDWIDEHRDDLARQETLAMAAADWEESGHHPDYLWTGDRLAQHHQWWGSTPLELTAGEVRFLQTSLSHREEAEAAEEERRRREAVLARRARRRLWGLGAAFALLVAVVTFVVLGSLPEPAPDLAVVINGTVGDGGYHDLFEAGHNRAVEEYGIHGVFVPATAATAVEDLERLSERGTRLIVVSSSFGLAVEQFAAKYPEVRYVIMDHPFDSDHPDVIAVRFAEQEGSFLMGAAAAHTTTSGTVGFVGGVDIPVIRGFHAGFEAGVRHVDPEVSVEAVYLTPGEDLSGFASPTLGAIGARELYESGADVVYQAAGFSGIGVFDVAAEVTEETGQHVWVIGVDQDQYVSLGTLGPDAERWRPHILTSMVKRIDVAIVKLTEELLSGTTPTEGVRVFGLAEGGLDYATSGGFIRHLEPELSRLRAGIIDGTIVVPDTPPGPVRMLAED